MTPNVASTAAETRASGENAWTSRATSGPRRSGGSGVAQRHRDGRDEHEQRADPRARSEPVDWHDEPIPLTEERSAQGIDDDAERGEHPAEPDTLHREHEPEQRRRDARDLQLRLHIRSEQLTHRHVAPLRERRQPRREQDRRDDRARRTERRRTRCRGREHAAILRRGVGRVRGGRHHAQPEHHGADREERCHESEQLDQRVRPFDERCLLHHSPPRSAGACSRNRNRDRRSRSESS
jgi:hypothetical protein